MKFLFAACIPFMLFSVSMDGRARAQGVGSYGRLVQKCSLTISNQTIPFRCRWMRGGSNNQTIFVDNYDTDESYDVEEYRWSILNKQDSLTDACIKSRGGAVVCLLKRTNN